MAKWVISCQFCDFRCEVEGDEPPVPDTPNEVHMPVHTQPGGRDDVTCPGSDHPGEFEGHPHS